MTTSEDYVDLLITVRPAPTASLSLWDAGEQRRIQRKELPLVAAACLAQMSPEDQFACVRPFELMRKVGFEVAETPDADAGELGRLRTAYGETILERNELLTRLTAAETANRDGFELSHAALDAAGVPAAASHLERVRLLIARVTEAEARAEKAERLATTLDACNRACVSPEAHRAALAEERSKLAEAEALAKEFPELIRMALNRAGAPTEMDVVGVTPTAEQRIHWLATQFTSERARREAAEAQVAALQQGVVLADARAADWHAQWVKLVDERRDIAKALGVDADAGLPSKVAEVVRERDRAKHEREEVADMLDMRNMQWQQAERDRDSAIQQRDELNKKWQAQSEDLIEARRRAKAALDSANRHAADATRLEQQRDELERRVNAWEPVVEAATEMRQYWRDTGIDMALASDFAIKLRDAVDALPTPKPLVEGDGSCDVCCGSGGGLPPTQCQACNGSGMALAEGKVAT